ncbi:MAG: hypothetical protein M3Q44_04155 [bacterium]|nr:hypothetical protein [bacterium]
MQLALRNHLDWEPAAVQRGSSGKRILFLASVMTNAKSQTTLPRNARIASPFDIEKAFENRIPPSFNVAGQRETAEIGEESQYEALTQP